MILSVVVDKVPTSGWDKLTTTDTQVRITSIEVSAAMALLLGYQQDSFK